MEPHCPKCFSKYVSVDYHAIESNSLICDECRHTWKMKMLPPKPHTWEETIKAVDAVRKKNLWITAE